MAKLAFLFPGQGSQKVGMGGELGQGDAELLQTGLRDADAASGLDVSGITSQGPIEDLTRTEVAQPALYAVSLALARVAGEVGLSPDFVAGHSLGEYTAASAAGALHAEDGMRLVSLRGRLMAEVQERNPGAMAATGGVPEVRLEQLCASAAEGAVLGLANINSPKQIVVSGESAAVDRMVELVNAEPGGRAMRLPVGAAFHSEYMRPVRDELETALAGVEIADPAVPLVANHSGRAVNDAAGVREALLGQIASPVRFTECVGSLVEAGCTSFLELGPGRVLTGLVRQIAGREVHAAPADSRAALEEFAAAMEAG